MQRYDVRNAKGFEVLHNSTGWRIAEHAYKENVNGMSAFLNWGRHLDSEEAFLLLCGNGGTSCDSFGGKCQSADCRKSGYVKFCYGTDRGRGKARDLSKNQKIA